MKPLSIAIWQNLPSGGAKRSLWQQVAGLKERGHRVKVWSPTTADHAYLNLAELVEERVLPLAASVASRWDMLASPTAAWRNNADTMQGLCAQAAREMKAEGFDLLLAHCCQQLVVPPIAAAWDGPSLLYLPEPNRGLYEARPELRWVGLRPQSAWPFSRPALALWRELARVGAAAAHERAEAARFGRILVNSYFSREAIARCYGLDAVVCYLGVDQGLFRPLGLLREDFVLGVGAAEPHKGMDLAIRTVAALPAGGPRKLRWVANKASPEHSAQMQALAAGLGVDFALHVRISDNELVQLLNRARVFLYCSVLEPFGYAPLEAMACGTPVVSVGEGGVREFIRDGVTGLLVGQRSPAALARALARVIDSPALAAQLGEAGRRTAVEDWTLERATDRLEANLSEVLAGAPGRP